MSSAAPVNPCVRCGACCASFVVPFYWSEADDAGGRVPAALTEPLPPHRLCMAGTNTKSPRCAALAGTVGESVSCTIYTDRPTPCRAFARHGDAGQANESCTRARERHGLPPLPLAFS
jgi:uncharacterized protein